MVQPYLTKLLARQRMADLHRSARSAARCPAAVRSGTRAGRALVTIGLALAPRSGAMPDPPTRREGRLRIHQDTAKTAMNTSQLAAGSPANAREEHGIRARQPSAWSAAASTSSR